MSTHPTRQDLADFLLEKLDSERTEAIGQHVDGCSECQQALVELEEKIKLPGKDSAVKCPSNVLEEMKHASPPLAGTQTEDYVPKSGEAPPEQIGPFPVIEELGAGGMGIVYKVKDSTFDRELAVKVLKKRLQSNPQAHQRFKDEARIMAQLQHPGITPVHTCGDGPNGRPYLVMKEVEGDNLSTELEKIIKKNELKSEWPRLLTIFGQVCQTVAYAHSENVIHLDLKPRNIMVGAHGEVQVMDWGLARRLQDESGADSKSNAGAIGGTPSYMAPEQALGKIAEIGKRTDVYGLGAVLCEILTGKPPFLESDNVNIQDCIDLGYPKATWNRLAHSGADPELIELCKKCLVAAKSRRLNDAGEVAKAVSNYQQEVERKLRASEVQRERNRTWLVLALAMLVIVVGVAVGWVSYADYQAEKTQQHNQRVNDTRQDTKSKLLDSQNILAKSQDAIREHDLKRWESLLAGADSPLKSAETILEDNKDVAPSELVNRVKQLRESLKLDKKDHRLMVQLDDVLLQSLEPPEFSNGNVKTYNTAAAYKNAFREYGITADTTPSRAADRVNKRSKQVRDKIISALDNWMILAVAKNEGPTVQWLKKVLTASDPDPFRTLIRLDIVEKATASLKSKAEKLDMRKHSLAVIHLLGSALLENDDENVLTFLKNAHTHHPVDFWINYQLGVLYLDLKEYDKSIHHCNVTVAVRPKSSLAHFIMAQSYEAKKDLQAAGLAYKRAVDANPDFGSAHYNLGAVNLKNLGDPQKSMAYFKKSLKNHPFLDHGYNSIGAAYVRMGKFPEACRAYEKAIQLSPKNTLFHRNFALAKYWDTDLKGAIKAYRKQLNLQPNSLYIISKLGVLYEYQNDLKAAEEILRKGIRLDPGSDTLHSNLGHILREQGKFQEALAVQQKATDLAKANGGDYDRNVRVLNLCKRLSELNAQWKSIESGDTRPTSV